MKQCSLKKLKSIKGKKEATKSYFTKNACLIVNFIVTIYLPYAYCKNEDDSGSVKHMKLFGQYSGYVGFINNLM